MTRRVLLSLLTALCVAFATVPAAGSSASAAVDLPRGLTSLLADGTPSGRAIVTLDSVPTPLDVSALKALGLTVQPMHRLPLAIVAGPVAAMRTAVTSGVAQDVYPDERLQLLDTASTDAMGGAATRAKGLTGKGVTVGIVDSGCDATQPDLADHVKHNVSLLSAW